MRRVVRFYDDVERIKNKATMSTILKWSDYQWQVHDEQFNWMFPLPDDDKFDIKLVKGLQYKFRTSQLLRGRVETNLTRFMSFLGFDAEGKQIKPLKRDSNSIMIGLYNPDTLKRITRILQFLMLIQMETKAEILVNTLISALKANPDLLFLVDKSEQLQLWLLALPISEKERYKLAENLCGRKVEEWEVYEDEKEPQVLDAWY